MKQARRRVPVRGLVCPRCGKRRFEVLYTRPKDGVIVRRKACLACGRRILTRETAE